MAEAPNADEERRRERPASLHALPVECIRVIASKAGLLALRAVAESSSELSENCNEIGIVSCRRCPQLWLDSGQPAKTCSFHGCSGWPCAPDLTRHLARR